MCGGRGRRLGSLTEMIPKPLVKIRDKTILQIKIEQYCRQGFKDFIFCIGYKGEMIKEEIANIALDINPQFSNAGEEAGILERLYTSKDFFDDYVLMTYGDTFTDIDLNDLIQAHLKSGNEATIVAAPIQNPFGLVEFDQEKRMTLFDEKPVLKYYIGYAVINKTAFDFVSAKVIHMPDGEGLVTFYKFLMAIKKIGVYYHPGVQITFNTRQELKIAREKINRFYTTAEEE